MTDNLEVIKFKTEDEAIDYVEKLKKDSEKIIIEEYYHIVITAFIKDSNYQVYFTDESETSFEIYDYLIKGKNIEKILDKILEIRNVEQRFRESIKKEYLKIFEGESK
jgi:hypothetical protein